MYKNSDKPERPPSRTSGGTQPGSVGFPTISSSVSTSRIPSGTVPSLPTTGQPADTTGVPVWSTLPLINPPRNLVDGGSGTVGPNGISISVPGQTQTSTVDDGKILGLSPWAAVAIGISGAVILTALLMKR